MKVKKLEFHDTIHNGLPHTFCTLKKNDIFVLPSIYAHDKKNHWYIYNPMDCEYTDFRGTLDKAKERAQKIFEKSIKQCLEKE